ncbi:Alpha-/beta-galactoside alpha-2,3-sialyltransferase (plasmid) [Vibrio harveyi]|uniref:hypothetical protein n=1 Tax=Vibrio harveyi TaxID=669 RepID=UPI002B29DA8D|nr:Alpha-/beta-galactoside alpha-2,3-sialyltransferase [Vibrio harveyi]
MFNRFKTALGLVLVVVTMISGCNSDSSPENTSSTLEIYIDSATLPSLQHMVKIIDEQSGNKKLINWKRYPIDDELLLDKINALSFSDTTDLTRYMESILLIGDIKRVVINGNSLSNYNIVGVMRSINALGLDLDVEINFYDDGSAEYVRLYNFSQLPEAERELLVSISKNNILAAVNGIGSYDSGSPENIYGFAQIYPATYHMLRADIFDTDLEIGLIRDILGDNVKQMKWGQFLGFNEEQKELFYQLTSFNPDKIQAQYKESPNKNFVFVGTNSRSATAEQQINIIKEAKKLDSEIIPNSIDGYDLFFKGHPSATYNQQIVDAHDMTEIYNRTPFEVLAMTSSLPDAVGGMGSSLFFSLPKTVETKFIFYKSGTDIESNALIQVMLKLGIITDEKVRFTTDIK